VNHHNQLELSFAHAIIFNDYNRAGCSRQASTDNTIIPVLLSLSIINETPEGRQDCDQRGNRPPNPTKRQQNHPEKPLPPFFLPLKCLYHHNNPFLPPPSLGLNDITLLFKTLNFFCQDSNDQLLLNSTRQGKQVCILATMAPLSLIEKASLLYP